MDAALEWGETQGKLEASHRSEGIAREKEGGERTGSGKSWETLFSVVLW